MDIEWKEGEEIKHSQLTIEKSNIIILQEVLVTEKGVSGRMPFFYRNGGFTPIGEGI